MLSFLVLMLHAQEPGNLEETVQSLPKACVHMLVLYIFYIFAVTFNIKFVSRVFRVARLHFENSSFNVFVA